MKIENYEDYDKAVAKYDELEEKIKKLYETIWPLQDEANDILDEIISYDMVQSAFDE